MKKQPTVSLKSDISSFNIAFKKAIGKKGELGVLLYRIVISALFFVFVDARAAPQMGEDMQVYVFRAVDDGSHRRGAVCGVQ